MSLKLSLDFLDTLRGIFTSAFEDLDDLNLLDGLTDVLEDIGLDDLDDFVDDLVGDNIFRGGITSDRITGFLTDDLLIGFRGNDTLLGQLGDDILNGGDGNDVLRGMRDNDTLLGQIGRDLLDGGIGNDILVGGIGLDTLLGGLGRDTFVLERGKGTDRIRDFVNGQDRLKLPEGVNFRNLRIAQSGINTLITLGLGGAPLAILERVAASQINAADFTRILPTL